MHANLHAQLSDRMQLHSSLHYILFATAGYNGGVLASGRTGGGKTYTINALTKEVASNIFKKDGLVDVRVCCVEVYMVSAWTSVVYESFS